ncbi:hypothetical protein HNR19_000942 [Nocardioides thalensis]|uniref:Maltokinase N-terminal cap domain-containing protein n=1 Tax=Nocardioides thalensis TaxID=1914755 RepID=A0A853BYX1_9ACTN|nr:hypothetical protein [Nocardioides thalensis]NYJ00244.1 hypothetical protein [Nocardioides thalensis]
MATIYSTATIKPTKTEILEQICGGPVDVLGTYRFDDPDGEVGIEAFVVAKDGATRHVVLTYRGAPLEGAESHLVTTMEHSELGDRWIYDGLADPVAVGCFRRALLREQTQASLELYDGDKQVAVREPSIRLSVLDGEPVDDLASLTIATDLDAAPVDVVGPRLQASWDGGEAVVAGLG